MPFGVLTWDFEIVLKTPVTSVCPHVLDTLRLLT